MIDFLAEYAMTVYLSVVGALGIVGAALGWF